MYVLYKLDPMLHRVLPLSGHLLPGDDPGLDEEKHPADVLPHDADEGQAEGPGQVIVFPIGQEVPAVGVNPEDDEGDGAQGGRDDQVDAGPAEHGNAVVLIHAQQVHHDQDQGDQGADEAQAEEELNRHEKSCKKMGKGF